MREGVARYYKTDDVSLSRGMKTDRHAKYRYEELLLNWFRAKGEISNGAVEGLNNKLRVVTRRSYGFRTYNAMEIALYHTLGRLPEPESTHSFC